MNETLNTSVPESGYTGNSFPSTPDPGEATYTPGPGEATCTPDPGEAPYTPGQAPFTPDPAEDPCTLENQDVGGQESKRSSRVRSVPSKFKDFDTTVSLSAAKKSKISN